MFPYYSLLFLSMLSSLFLDFHAVDKRLKTLMFLLFVAVLTVFAGVRAGWPDQEAYEYLFIRIPAFSEFVFGQHYFDSKQEYCYLILNSIIKTFFNDPVSILLVVAFISVLFTLYVYQKYTPFFFLSVVLFIPAKYFPHIMTQMRMGLSSALVLFGMMFLIEGKRGMFFLFILIAASFQISALFALFGYVIYRLNLSNKSLMVLIIISFVIGATAPIANKLFSKALLFSGDNYFVERGKSYFEIQNSLGVFKPYVFKLMVLTLLAMLFRSFLAVKLKGFEVFFTFLCASVIWYLLFNDMAIIAGRGASIMSVGEPIIFASLLYPFKPSQRRFVVLGFYFASWVVTFLYIKVFHYPPYESILF